MRRVRGADGRVNFSTLKWMALSPAHYRASVEEPRPPTRLMRIGTITHHIVLGPRKHGRLVCFEGKVRSGKAWDAFVEQHPDAEIVTRPEWDAAELVARAVLRHPLAAELLEKGEHERPLHWDDAGVECTTGGIDHIGDGYLVDLKTMPLAEPGAVQRKAFSMQYHAQLAFYETGALQNGIDTAKGLFLIAAETAPPYGVTVMRLTPAMVDHGRRQYQRWLERLRVCEENDFWPDYSPQTIVDLDLPQWLTEEPSPDPDWVSGEESAA